MPSRQKRFFRNEDGATAIEYGLFLAIIGAAIVAAVAQFGGNLAALFDLVASHFGATPQG